MQQNIHVTEASSSVKCIFTRPPMQYLGCDPRPVCSPSSRHEFKAMEIKVDDGSVTNRIEGNGQAHSTSSVWIVSRSWAGAEMAAQTSRLSSSLRLALSVSSRA